MLQKLKDDEIVKKKLKTILNKINNNQTIRTKFDTWKKLKEDKIEKK